MLPYATSDRDVDLVAVQRLLDDDAPLPELHEHEQEYAARRLGEQGLGAGTIAVRLRVAERTVTRWRAEWACREVAVR